MQAKVQGGHVNRRKVSQHGVSVSSPAPSRRFLPSLLLSSFSITSSLSSSVLFSSTLWLDVTMSQTPTYHCPLLTQLATMSRRLWQYLQTKLLLVYGIQPSTSLCPQCQPLDPTSTLSVLVKQECVAPQSWRPDRNRSLQLQRGYVTIGSGEVSLEML
jgi:hypothetical protein